jgi:sarcosine oxidase subunit gamma
MPEPAAEARRFEATGIAIDERTPRGCVDLRGDSGDPRFVRGVQSVTDLRLPRTAGESASGLLASILWLGPDEWLVTSETQAGETLAASLRKALAGVTAAVTDVGHARLVYAVSGSNARAVLAKGCALDLHERVFPRGRCAQSLLAKVPVIVHRSGADAVFDLHVARSFRDYAWDWLQTAASEYVTEGPGGPQTGLSSWRSS